MFPLGDPPDYEPDPATSVAADGRSPGPRAGRRRLRPDARRRRPRPAVHAGRSTSPTARSTPSTASSPTRRRSPGCPTAVPTSARSATSASRPRCCSGGDATAPRPAAGRAAREQADAGDGRDGRSARPRAARRRPPGRHQRHRLRRPCACTRRSSPTTCRPAAGACCSVPTATSTRSSPARRSARAASRPAPRPGDSSAAPSARR